MSSIELRVGGKYRLGRKIGSGSFGDIYLGASVMLYRRAVWMASFGIIAFKRLATSLCARLIRSLRCVRRIFGFYPLSHTRTHTHHAPPSSQLT